MTIQNIINKNDVFEFTLTSSSVAAIGNRNDPHGRGQVTLLVGVDDGSFNLYFRVLTETQMYSKLQFMLKLLRTKCGNNNNDYYQS
jgi:hypothetical protein